MLTGLSLAVVQQLWAGLGWLLYSRRRLGSDLTLGGGSGALGIFCLVIRAQEIKPTDTRIIKAPAWIMPADFVFVKAAHQWKGMLCHGGR